MRAFCLLAITIACTPEIVRRADGAEARGDVREASKLLEEAVAQYPDDNELRQRFTDVAYRFAQDFLNQRDPLLVEQDFPRVLRYLEQLGEDRMAAKACEIREKANEQLGNWEAVIDALKLGKKYADTPWRMDFAAFRVIREHRDVANGEAEVARIVAEHGDIVDICVEHGGWLSEGARYDDAAVELERCKTLTRDATRLGFIEAAIAAVKKYDDLSLGKNHTPGESTGKKTKRKKKKKKKRKRRRR